MTSPGIQSPDKYREPLPSTFLPDPDQGGSSLQLLRLFAVPAVVTVLLVGGVYWVRLQVPAGAIGRQQASVVQVHLIPRPAPASIAETADSPAIVENVSGRIDAAPKDPDFTSDRQVKVPQAKAYSPAEAPPANIGSIMSTAGAPPQNIAVKFQQALLRHVERYQSDPNTRPFNLRGTVVTRVSMRRDGTLIGVWVKTSSGQVILDKEAVETIRRSQPLPPVPRELPDRLTFDMGLDF
jgi:protein TonB